MSFGYAEIQKYRNTADFASALGNVNNVKILNWLEFVEMMFFSSICSQLKSLVVEAFTSRKLQVMRAPTGETLSQKL